MAHLSLEAAKGQVHSGTWRAGRGRPSMLRTFQLVGTIPLNGDTSEDTFGAARKIIVEWAGTKVSSEIPDEVLNGGPFTFDVPGQKLECLQATGEAAWALRLEQPDMPYLGRGAVGGRTWTTDIALQQETSSITLGARVICTTVPDVIAPVAFTRPRVVGHLAEALGLIDVLPIQARPWVVGSKGEIDRLYEFVVTHARTLPIVLLTQPDKSKYPVPMRDYVLDAEFLARRLEGIAHVVALPWDIGYLWTERVGRPWSAYLGAVRTYWPGLDFESDPPLSHPRTLVEQILFWKTTGSAKFGERGFADFLVGSLYKYAAAKRVEWASLVRFLPELRSEAAARGRQESTGREEWKQLYEDELQARRGEIAQLRAEAQEFNDDAMHSERERDEYKRENTRLRFALDTLRHRLAEKADGSLGANIPNPPAYVDLPEWVDTQLVGRVVLHPRALRGVKDGRFEDPRVVYEALLLLGSEYRDMRMGVLGAREAFEAQLGKLGIRLSGSIAQERAGEEGDTYFVKYPLGSTRSRFLDSHLRKGTAKDDRYCMAVYFLWDEDTNQVVIGWLPSHLENRMT